VGQSHFTYTESNGTGNEIFVIKKIPESQNPLFCFLEGFESGKREYKNLSSILLQNLGSFFNIFLPFSLHSRKNMVVADNTCTH
jgi:hypothetical protein